MAGLTLHLIRHGETDWNRVGRIQGGIDIPLNARGREQAHTAAEQLAVLEVGAVITSDLRRAAETAVIIAAPHGLTPIPEPALRERRFGTLEGRLYDDVVPGFDADWTDVLEELDRYAPGAESTLGHYERVAAFLDQLLLDPPAPAVVLVAHGGTIRRVLAYLNGGSEPDRRRHIDNAVVHTVALGGEREVPAPLAPAAESPIGGGTTDL